MRIALLVPLLAGCQVVVGDIELPTLIEEQDAAWDAELVDATPPDMMVVPDLAPPVDMAPIPDMAPPVDMAWDQAQPDMAPAMDMGVDAVAPDMYMPTPTDLTALAGTWHLYGIRGREQALSAFSAALRVNGDGEARLTEIGSQDALSEVSTLFDPHPDGTARVSINLFPRAGRLAGMMDPAAGVAVFINDVEFADTTPTLVLGTRINAVNVLPERSLFVDLVAEPGPGPIEGGILVRQGQGEAYLFDDRVRSADGELSMPESVEVSAIFTPTERLRMGNDAQAQEYVLSPAAGGNGAFGMAGVDGNDPPNVLAAWHNSSGLFVASRFWCAGNGLDADGNHRTLSAFAELRADGAMVFDNGVAVDLDHSGDAFTLRGEPNFFLGATTIATLDPDQRGMLLVDAGPFGVAWGLGFCVNTEPAIQ